MIKDKLTLFKSAEKTSSSETGAIDVSDSDEMSIYLDVTVASGTDKTLDVTIQDSPDGVKWYDKESFTQATGVTSEAKRITNYGNFVRVKYVIGETDTPTFTFEVKAVGRNH